MNPAGWALLLLGLAILLVWPRWGLLAWWQRYRERREGGLREGALNLPLKREAAGPEASPGGHAVGRAGGDRVGVLNTITRAGDTTDVEMRGGL